MFKLIFVSKSSQTILSYSVIIYTYIIYIYVYCVNILYIIHKHSLNKIYLNLSIKEIYWII